MAVVSSYSTLLTEVASWLARSDLTTAIPGFVQNFEEDFLTDPDNHAPWMETALSVSIANNVAVVPTSPQYLALKIAYIGSGPPLRRISLEQLYSRYPRGVASNGTPAFIARNGANFEFGPVSTAGTLAGTYYAKPTALRNFTTGGADAVAHFLIVNCPQLCLYGSLLHAEPFLKNDERVMMWKSAYDMQVDSYRRRFVDEDRSGSSPFTVEM